MLEAREMESTMPFDRIERDEACGFLMRIVATLPPRQQEVLQLKFQSDLSYQQIAEIIQTNANNVGVLDSHRRENFASKIFRGFERFSAI